MYALHQPEIFSSVCPLRARIGPLSIEEAKTRMDKSDPGITDEAQIKAYFEKRNTLELVNQMPDDQKNAVRVAL